MSKIEIHIDHQGYSGESWIYIVDIRPDGSRALAQPVEFVFGPIEQGRAVEPTIRLGLGYASPFLQAFADLCHKLNIMPQGKPVLENELTAMKYHLEDMRKLVFKKKD